MAGGSSEGWMAAAPDRGDVPLTVGILQHLVVFQLPRQALQDGGDGQHELGVPARAQPGSGVRAGQQDQLPHQALRGEGGAQRSGPRAGQGWVGPTHRQS